MNEKFEKWLFEQGKKWVTESDLRHLDRTAFIFVSLLEELKRKDLADKLSKYYDKL